MKSITTLSKLSGKKALIRVDFNVPMNGNRILDARRIESSYRTIDFVLKKGCTPILLAHLGDATATLKPVAKFLQRRYKVLFISDTIDTRAMNLAIDNAQKKTVVLLENIRRNPSEEKNDKAFAKTLASLGDMFINDAFSVSHRPHTTVVGLPKLLPSYAGFQLQDELAALDSVLKTKTKPFLFILGGAKFATKIPLIQRFSSMADGIIITGAILNNFYKTAGMQVGRSVVEDGFDVPIKKLLKHPNLLLPTDVVVQRGKKSFTISAHEVGRHDKIVDIGLQSIELIVRKISKAKLVVWNGPTGWYEAGFATGTIELAKALIKSHAKVVIGGGDTAAVIERAMKGKRQKRIFVSTGGGAALEYLASGTLVGIKALG